MQFKLFYIIRFVVETEPRTFVKGENKMKRFFDKSSRTKIVYKPVTKKYFFNYVF